MEALATLHIRCLNLVPCKFEIQFKSYRVIVMKCCPAASRNLLSDSWFDSWVGPAQQLQVLCESTDWHHQRRNTIQVMMQEHNDCRDPTIVAWSFPGYQFITHPQRALQLNAIGLLDERLGRHRFPMSLQVGSQRKLKKKWRWLGASNMMCLRLETMLCQHLYTFVS